MEDLRADVEAVECVEDCAVSAFFLKGDAQGERSFHLFVAGNIESPREDSK